MSPDLKDLLDDAARAPRRGLDVEDIHRRGRRGRAAERAAGAVAIVALLGGAAAGISRLSDVPNGGPVIQDPVSSAEPTVPESSTSTPVPSEEAVPTVAASDLSADVFTLVSEGPDRGSITVSRPDGTSTTWHVEGPSVADAEMVPDGSGGVIWQPLARGDGSAAIEHLSAPGERRVLVPATGDAGDLLTLVGSSGSGVYVQQRTGTTPEDMRISVFRLFLGGDPEVVLPPVPGWETSYNSAVGLEIVAYTIASEGSQALVMDRPDAAPVEVIRGDLSGGAHVRDLALGSRDTVYALYVEDDDLEERSVVVHTLDAQAESPSIGATVQVPLRLGVPKDTGLVMPVDISAAGDLVVVNRVAESSGFLPPLVWDASRGPDAWSVLDVGGRAVVGPPTGAPSVAPACAGDTELRDAAPIAGRMFLYASCAGEIEPWHAYRLDLSESSTGDVETDAGTVLEAIFGDLPDELAGRGYTGLTLDIYPDDSGLTDPSIAGITFEDGLLTLDFDAPDGFGNFSTSAGSSIWHTLLAANLLQIDDVEVVELHARGGCDGYSSAFESDGCIRLTAADDAPWNGDRVFD